MELNEPLIKALIMEGMDRREKGLLVFFFLFIYYLRKLLEGTMGETRQGRSPILKMMGLFLFIYFSKNPQGKTKGGTGCFKALGVHILFYYTLFT